MSEKEWRSPRELAEWLGVPVNTIYQWRHKGTGPQAVKIGRHVRFRQSDVENWLRVHTNGPDRGLSAVGARGRGA